jgi:hypothetical protein
MNAVTLPTRSASAWHEAATFVWRAWAGTTRRQWGWVLVIGCVISLVVMPHRFETIQKVGWHPLPAITEMMLPMLATVPMFLGWVLADAGSDAWRSRRTRLLYALLGAGAVATVLTVGLWFQSGADDLWARLAAEKGKAPKAGWLMLAADYINILVVGGMAYAVAEVFHQRCRTQLAFEASSRQQVTLEQQLLESRLAAMQAKVEPRFLFDTLVDIEALYQRDAHRAAENLDRLIAYLRAALPRLRDSGSSIEAEIELVRAYLAVVTSLHDGKPGLSIRVAENCRAGRFYPMLLLPLVQRAVRNPAGDIPEHIAIDIQRGVREIIVGLRIDRSGGCADDPELARVRERLEGLYGKAASLDCVELDGQATALTMRIPAQGAAA